MEAKNNGSEAFENALASATGGPNEPSGKPDDRRLNICVIFTSAESTLAALQTASGFANNLGAQITLMAPLVVPFPLPLEDPPVLLDWNKSRFRYIASQSPVKTVVRLFLCRDKVETLKRALSPKSMIVIGSRKRRWPFTAEKRLARELRRTGHEIIFAETK